jgi:hypothetical protein
MVCVAGFAQFRQQLENGAFSRSGHPAGRTNAVSLYQGRYDSGTIRIAQAIHNE